ncbi:hypothetical protein [Thermococcus thioreducens]|uniref:Uncharacterized protein n=1 Tax=Thermococcus thioreducens TaxID=277988 RepID=A0A0Q2S4W4_9EURY|nr:hypothetical protein [Thermococcus thioreducens]ASJ12489.1 hypothetical protein A3L14_06105 [Thermococcus thioreducens]KQH82507.1 hypothetical protein AMR53_06140 [Thermococcus thioreducens]SEV89910.1 hypothetical protein SAMN05216170_0734 [Thermococcus thioreducens]
MEDVEAQVERLFLDAQNLLLKIRLKGLRKSKVTLEELIQLAEEQTEYTEEVEDITEMVREMRERDYDY